jgi:hypothetical protein
MSVADRLRGLHESPPKRWGVMAGGAIVGLSLAQFHWLGFAVGGGVVGVAASDTKRALAAGFGFGVIAWAVFLALFALDGSAGRYLAMGQITYLSAAIPIVLSTIGSSIRFAL